MKSIHTILIAALLLAVAPAAFAVVPSSMFVMTGTVQAVNCSPGNAVSLNGPKTIECKLDILPTGSRVATTLGCLDPKVGLACSALEVGEPVLVVGDPTTSPETVTHIGLWLDGSIR